MSKISKQKHRGGCTQQMVNLREDPPGENDTSIPAMTQHEESHLDETSYICNQCGKNLISYSKFMKHQETVHKNDQAFKCPECDESYNNLLGLKLHQEMHIKKKLYTCTACDKAFIYKSHLIEHQKTHMGADTGAVKEAGMRKDQNLETIHWSMEEKREIMYCHFYASSLRNVVYMQVLRSKLEERGIFPLAKLRCCPDSKLKTVMYSIKYRQYITDDDLEMMKKAAKDEIAYDVVNNSFF